MKEIIYYILYVAGTLAMVGALLSPAKKIKQILFFDFLGSLLVGTGYLFSANGINGAISVYVAALMALINFGIQSKEKDIPVWLMVVYGITFAVMNFISGITGLAVLAVIASLTFVIGIGQNNGTAFRRWTLANSVLWCGYDVLSATYAGLIPHGVMLVFTIIGMIIHDRKNKWMPK